MTRGLPIAFFLATALLVRCRPGSSSDAGKAHLDRFTRSMTAKMDSAAVAMRNLMNSTDAPEDARARNTTIHSLARYEQAIDASLDSINRLIAIGEITQEDFRQATSGLNTHPSMRLTRELKNRGIDITTLPTTHDLPLERTFTSDRLHLSGRLPKDWRAVEDTMGFELVALSPPYAGPSGLAQQDALMLIRNDDLQGVSLDEYYKGNLMSMKKEALGFRILEEFHTNVGGEPARYALLSYMANGQALTSVQFYFLRKGVAMSCGAGTNTTDADGFARMIGEIVASMDFTD